MKWNSKNWQGKRKSQVEDSLKSIYLVSMLITLWVIIFFLSSCSTTKECYVQRSNITITNDREKIIYIKNNDVGSMIYGFWVNGVYGDDYRPILVTDSTFNFLIRK